MRKNGLEKKKTGLRLRRHRVDTKTQEGEITLRHFRMIKGELTDLKDQKREISHRHFKRIKGELTDLNDFIRGDH